MQQSRLKFKNYYLNDGLHSNGFEEVCGLMKDGYVYAGGVNGFTVIDPSKFTTNKVLPVLYFTNIQTELEDKVIDTSNLKIKLLEIPNNWLRTNVSFVGLNYTNPERVTYEYRIREQSKYWINIGTQNFVNLIGLSPGTCTLQVKAANEDGVECKPIELTLIYLPKWYQTWEFKLFVILAIAGLLYAFYRYRISQIRRQQQIRKDIASDLHDDIGSTLNTVKVFTHLAQRDTKKTEYLNQIEEALTQATIGLRDMIWVLDDAQDTTFELMERIKKFALPVLHANNIQLDTLVESANGKMLSKTEKTNLLLIAKESINNSIKYVACRNIKVQIQQADGKTALFIQDDGKGFDTSILTEGNGLKNIYQRARQIHYYVEIISSPENGTSIKLVKK